MCDISMALTLGATLLGAAGQVQQGQAAKEAGEYNAKVGEMNATLAERRAKDALERGKVEEQQKRQEVQGVLGRQQAAMAANGVDITFGSPLDTLIDTSTMGELDALTIRTNTAREAYDFRVDAANKRAGASMDRAAGNNALKGSYLGAGGTVLTGMASGYKSYKSGQIGAIS